MSRLIPLCLVPFCLLGLPSRAVAQVINVMPLITAETEEGFHLEAKAGGSFMTGNVPYTTAKAALLARWVSEKHRVISSSSAEFGQGAADPFLNRQTSHLRYQYAVTDRLTWEAFAQVAHDQIWRLRLRALAGTGMRGTLITSEAVDLVAGGGYMFEREQLSREEEVSDSGLIRHNHRLSTYATVVWRIDPPFSIVHTTYFQPRFDDFTDLRLFSTTAAVVRIKERFALSTSFQLMYNSWTPDTILPLDTTTAVELTVGF